MKTFFPFISIFFGFLALGQGTLESFLSYSFPSDLAASQDAGKIAWVVNKEGVRNIYSAMAPDYHPKQITNYQEDDGQQISDLLFYGEQIVFVRGGAANRKGEFPNPNFDTNGVNREIFLVATSDAAPHKLASGGSPVRLGDLLFFLKEGKVFSCHLKNQSMVQLFVARGNISSLRPSPDGLKLAFISARGDHAFLGIYDLKSKKLTYPDPSVDLDSNPVWSPDGKYVAVLRIPYQEQLLFVSKRSAQPFSIRVIDVATATGKTWWQASPGGGSAFHEISADNQLFWMADQTLIFPWEKDGWLHLYEISTEGGTAQLLTPGPFELQYVSQSPDRTQLFYSGNENDLNRQHVWSIKNNTLTSITSGPGIEWSPVMDGAGNLFMLGSSGTKPASVKQRVVGDVRDIFTSDPYPSSQLVMPQEVVFEATDGITIHGQLFMPKDLKKGEKKPALLFFHGGSRRQMLLGFHHRDYYHYAYAMNQYLASKGYLVLSVNYRSGTGYGMEFREALNYGAGGASEFNDVIGAGLFLQAHSSVDPSKIGLWGGSYGGYLTALGLAKRSDLFAAGVDIHGVMDWNVIIHNFVPTYEPLEHPAFAKLAYDSSPIAVIDSWRSPVLLIHGDDDRNVPFSETVDKVKALRDQGVYFEQLIFPDEVHGFLLHQNWKDAYQATVDFFDRMIK
jgi:dipeptidyl aminopeptidase/acylaminoacyl peptidase|tara:strand:- start:23771 stop:25798 length:2028 start_codon:yes stop_codon:yes gene_type:complete